MSNYDNLIEMTILIVFFFFFKKEKEENYAFLAFLSVKSSGETYSAVPTNEFARSTD